MQAIILFILAVVPGVLLLLFILYMDRREPEPVGYIILAVFLGAVSCIPAGIIELILGLIPVFNIPILGKLLFTFIVIAPVEELAKLGVVMLFIWKSKNFNEENDGIVYVGTSALGFAVFENIFYVLKGGIAIGLARAVTSVPLHCFTGIIMGYFVGLAKFSGSKDSMKKLIQKGFFIAYIIHAVYDGVIFTVPVLAIFAIPVIIVLLVIFGIKYLKTGRSLSLNRWDGDGNAPASIVINRDKLSRYSKDELEEDSEGRVYLLPKKAVWKFVVSIILLGFSALVWLLFILVYLDSPKKIPELIGISEYKEKIINKLEENAEKKKIVLNSYIIDAPPVIDEYIFNERIIAKLRSEKDKIALKAYYDFNGKYELKKSLDNNDKMNLLYILNGINYNFDYNIKIKKDLTEENKKLLYKILHEAGYIFAFSDVVIASGFFTLLPVIIGVILEISYFRRKKKILLKK